MSSNRPLFVNGEQVRNHLQMTDLIPAMEKALIDFSTGKVTQPVRSVIKVDPPGGFLGLMPALTPNGLGLKAVTFYPSNAERAGCEGSRDSWQRRASTQSFRGAAACQTFRGDPRVESYEGTCGAVC